MDNKNKYLFFFFIIRNILIQKLAHSATEMNKRTNLLITNTDYLCSWGINLMLGGGLINLGAVREASNICVRK